MVKEEIYQGTVNSTTLTNSLMTCAPNNIRYIYFEFTQHVRDITASE